MRAPLIVILRRLFGSCRQGSGRGRKRPETFFTPYEIEMVPLMLKELDDLDHRFYQMVCYRWFKEVGAPLVTADGATPVDASSNVWPLTRSSCSPNACNLSVSGTANCSASTTTISTTSSTKFNKCLTPTFEDFVNEGQALRHLIRFLSRTLRETGTFDDACEAHISAYRASRQQWQQNRNVIISTNSNVSAERMRSSSALPNIADSGTYNSAYVTSSTSSNASSTFSTANFTPINAPILMLNNKLSDEEDELGKQKTNGIQRRRPATTIIDSRESTATTTMDLADETQCISTSASASVTAPKSKKMSKRALRKQRQRDAAACDALFVHLGDILRHQFHTTVIVEGGIKADGLQTNMHSQLRTESTPHNENVHERELKVLIWRHFVQMLVAVLTDRDRFPI